MDEILPCLWLAQYSLAIQAEQPTLIGELVYGQTAVGEMSSDQATSWGFEGEAGEQYTFFLEDPNGYAIEFKGFSELGGVFRTQM